MLPSVGETALKLASAGIPVLPIWSISDGECDCGRSSCTAGKHPVGVAPFVVHGVKDASTDFETIKDWFSRYETANLGVACGHRLEGGGYLVVVDIDPGRGGRDSIRALEEEHGELPRAAAVTTGSGGMHIYMSTSEQLPQSNDRLGIGIEVKSLGGYVVAPPSLHKSGRRYEWPSSFDPSVLAFIGAPPAPGWFIADAKRREQPITIAAEHRSVSAQGRPDLVALLGSALGNLNRGRNKAMFGFACAARDSGYSCEEVVDQAALFADIVNNLKPTNGNEIPEPYAARELKRSIDSAFSQPPRPTAQVAQGKFEIVSPSLDRVTPIHWAWRDWLAMGMFNLLVGEEGAGKGTLIAYLIAKLTRGELDGDLHGDPAMVLILGEEDDFDRTWTPRLHVAGADLDFVCLIRGTNGETLSFPSGIEELRRIIHKTQARVVFFDQLLDNLDANIDDWRPKSVRGAIRPLHALAGEFQVAAIGTLHTNKAKGTSFRQSVSGSHSFNSISRSSLLVALHPDGPEERRVVARGKGNYAQRPISQEFTIVGRSPKIGDKVIQTSVAMDFKDSPLTADELLVPRKTEPTSKAATAREFIQRALADGAEHDAAPIIKHLSEDLGIADSAIRKAREDIGAISKRRSEFQGGVTWRLPDRRDLIGQFRRDGRNGDEPHNAVEERIEVDRAVENQAPTAL